MAKQKTSKSQEPFVCRLNALQVATVAGVTIVLKSSGTLNQSGKVVPEVVLEMSAEPRVEDQ